MRQLDSAVLKWPELPWDGLPIVQEMDQSHVYERMLDDLGEHVEGHCRVVSLCSSS